MPFNLPVANKGGEAPDVKPGLVKLRFDDLVLKEHEDWAGTDKFGHDDDGQRYHFQFTLLDKKGNVVVNDNDPELRPVMLEATTRTATGERSNFAKIMGGLLTAQEFAQWQAADEDNPFDGSALPGRIVDAKVAHNKNKWPYVEDVIGVSE